MMLEIGVVVAAQLDHRGDGIGVEQHADLRLGLVDGGEAARRPAAAVGLLGLDVGALDDLDVRADDHGGRQAAHPRLRGEELLEALALGIEQRLGAR